MKELLKISIKPQQTFDAIYDDTIATDDAIAYNYYYSTNISIFRFEIFQLNNNYLSNNILKIIQNYL